MRRSTVLSGTAALAVYERGEPTSDNETIVMVHGWPDSHALWDPVAERLASAGHHVVTYDVRGVGQSTPATVVRPFALAKLAADIDTVIASVSPSRAVHLVGHDWGGVQGWEYISSASCAGRVSTFTTVSGPNLDHLGHVMRSSPRAAVAQGTKSLYTLVLSAPMVRTAIWSLGFGVLFRRWLRVTEGIRPESGHPPPTLAADARAAVGLYRTNIFDRIRRPQVRPVLVPVHQIVATRDLYVSASVLASSEPLVDDFTRTQIEAGHWSPRTHPDEVARAIEAYLTDRASDASRRSA